MARGGRTARAFACLVAVVLVTAACTTAGSQGHRASGHGRSAGQPALIRLAVEGAPFTQTYGGWSTGDGFAFRMTLAISATGVATGKVTVVRTTTSDVEHMTSSFTGEAGPWRAKTHDRRLHLRLSHGVDFNRTFYGLVDDRHVGLQPPSESRSELGFYGSSVLVSKRFNEHVHILTAPGGYGGWLRRKRLGQAAVRHVDVDGDGRRDLVTVVWSSLSAAGAGSGTGARAVTVHYATGRIATIDVPAMNVGRHGVGWVGDAHLPGFAGRELFLFDGAGASNAFYDAVGDVGGALREIDGPGDGWNVGGTVGTGSLGFFCRGGVLHTTYEQYVARDHIHELDPPRTTDSRWVWRSTGWMLVGRTVERLPDTVNPKRFEAPRHHGLWGCG